MNKCFHCFLALLMLLPLGCGGKSGPERVAIHGRAMVAGKPIEEGSISFVPTDGNSGPTAGGVIKNGEYSIPAKTGPVSGPNRVDINGTHVTGRKVPSEMNRNVLVDEVIYVVPARYRVNSPLKCAVKSGELNFDLEAN